MTAKITFYGATRKTGNPNTNLEVFLNSIVAHAANPTDIEVLYAIDRDDDLAYFDELQVRYRNTIQLKFLISEVRHGYGNLHLYYREIFKQVAPTTRMLFGSSDDTQIVMPDFDLELLKIDARYADNIYFIHTRNTHRENYLGDVTQNMRLLFWVMQAKEPASYFPIISKRILDISQAYANVHDKKGEWIPIANSWILDCYIDILSVYCSKFGLDRIHHTREMIKLNEGQITADHHRPPHEFGLSPNNVGFIKMLSNETQDYLQGLAMEIVKACNYPKIAKVHSRVKRSLRVLRPWARAVRNNLRKINIKEMFK
jgi:hypothetical protein